MIVYSSVINESARNVKEQCFVFNQRVTLLLVWNIYLGVVHYSVHKGNN
jgi:hypothetical protein